MLIRIDVYQRRAKASATSCARLGAGAFVVVKTANLLNVTFLVSLVHVREASTTTPLDRIALGNPSPASTPKPALPECNRTRRGATSQRFEYRNPSDLHSSPAPGCSQVRREARRPIALRYVAPVPP